MHLAHHNKKLTPEDLIWIYNAAKEALAGVRKIESKSDAEIEGEVFTAMRRQANEVPVSHAIRGIFRAKKKGLTWRLSHSCLPEDQEILGKMFSDLKDRVLSKASPDPISELRMALLGMKASVSKAERVVEDSEKVRKGIDSIQNILDGKE